MRETINLYINRKQKDYRIYNAVLALLLYVGLGGVFLSILAFEYSKIVLLFTGLIAILSYTFFVNDFKKAIISAIGILGFSTLYFIAFNKVVGKGLKILLNSFIRLESIKLKTILAFWQVDTESISYSSISNIFLIPIALIFSFIVYLVVKHDVIAFPIVMLSSLVVLISFYDISSISFLVSLPFLCIYVMIVKKYFNTDNYIATIIPILSILLVFNLVSLPFSSSINSIFYKQKQNIDDKSHVKKFESISQPLPEGKLENFDGLTGDETLVALSLSEPTSENLYLRGFIGEKFEYGRWVNISNYDLYTDQINTYALYQAGFYPQNQVATLGKLLDYINQSKLRKVSIEIDNACRAYNYNSYGFISSEDDILSKYSLDSSSLLPSESYSFYYYTLDTTDYYNLLELYNKQSSAKFNEYKGLEKQYRNFVYSNYLDKDSSLENELSNISKIYGTKDYESILKNVKISADSYSYENSFIKSSYAAKLLRYYGIPSRYVEGYVIPAGKDYAEFLNAHAWVEYYMDGIGWVPFELCSEEIEDFEKIPTPINKNTEIKVNVDPPEETTENDKDNNKKSLWYIPIGFIIVTLCTFFIARILVINSRYNKYYSKDYNLSVNYIYNRLLFLLSAEKIVFDDTNLYNTTHSIKAILGDDLARDYALITKIAYKGVFSNKSLLKEDQEICIKILSNFINNAKKQKSNLFYKYILWLY